MKDYELKNNETEKRYEFDTEEGICAIDYMVNNHGTVYLTHTEVPYRLQGQGVGSQLAKKVLEDIDSKGLNVVPTCSFVAGYMMRNPEWKRLLMPGVMIG